MQRANLSDEEVDRIANQLFLSVDSPPARLDVIFDLLRSYRAKSRERVDWCRHLDLLEYLGREGDLKTAYSEFPTRICVCDKFDYETAHPSTDWPAVITEFKRTFCAGCLARDPKTKQENNG